MSVRLILLYKIQSDPYFRVNKCFIIAEEGKRDNTYDHVYFGGLFCKNVHF